MRNYTLKSLKDFVKLFNSETIMFIQIVSKNPVYQINKLNYKFGIFSKN